MKKLLLFLCLITTLSFTCFGQTHQESNEKSPTNTSIKSTDLSKNVRIYPNPIVDRKIRLRITGHQKITAIRVYNILGKELFFGNYRDRSLEEIDLSGFKSGIYLVKIESNKTSVVKKIIVK